MIKKISIISVIALTSILMAATVIHDSMDDRLKGRSFGGIINDKTAASDGLGSITLQNLNGSSIINNELKIQKLLTKLQKSESSIDNIKSELLNGTIGNAELKNKVEDLEADLNNSGSSDNGGLIVEDCFGGTIGDTTANGLIIVDNTTIHDYAKTTTPICTSNVTNFMQLYYKYSGTEFSNIEDWDTSNVTNMSHTFMMAPNFNRDISGWDTSSVTVMTKMFYFADTFNQPIGNWDVSNVYSMTEMLSNAILFNQPLNSWNVSGLLEANGLFYGASLFNQPLDNWDTSSLTSMNSFFSNTLHFNQDISSWNTSNVNNMQSMFNNAKVFNQPLNNWDVSNVTNMFNTFGKASAFNQPLNNWNVANVTDMRFMFSKATSFNQDLNSWNVNISVPSTFNTDSGFADNPLYQPIWK